MSLRALHASLTAEINAADRTQRDLDELRQAHDTLRDELTASEAERLRLTVENENLRKEN